MVEQDDTVCDVFFETKMGHSPVAAFRGHDRGHAFALQPAEQALQFSPDNGMVRQRGEKHIDGIQRYTLGADGVDRMTKTDEQPFQVVFSRLFDLAALDLDMIDYQFLVFYQIV